MLTEGFTDFEGFRLWYRIAKPATGDSTTPLLLLHGGPGGSSDIFEPLEELADQGTTIIRFDQLGCGRSDRPRDPALWTIASCLKQIETMRRAFGLDRLHLLGHSWGGMLALEYLLAQSHGIQSVCLSSPVISIPLWVNEALRLRSQLPAHIARALEHCEKSYRPRPLPPHGAQPAPAITQAIIENQARRMSAAFPVISHPLVAWMAAGMSYLPTLRAAAYEILSLQFVIRHICRRQPVPLGIFKMLAGVNGEIYETLWGPSEFFAPGLLKDWDIRPRLSEIHLPVLIISGRYDEATPAQMEILKNSLANAEQVILEQSAHCGMWEETETYRSAILSFFNRVEAGAVEPVQKRR